tara:strand:+ start:2733 stop:3437 length:705 start_codon:yes stop_codon:yes gene_type:complete
MSYRTHKNWFYQLQGRYIHLWQLADNSVIDTLGNYKIRLPAERISPQLIYPDEDITNGLRVEYTGFTESDLFISEAIETTTATASGTGISFDPGPAATISDTADGFSDFAQGDKIRVIGSTSNDGDYTLTPSGTVDEDTLTITGTFTTEAAGESITIYQIPKTGATADESAHVNLNRMLCLAVVDFMKAKQVELQGDIQAKEYYTKEFWKKVSDDQSNKRNISISTPIPAYSVR